MLLFIKKKKKMIKKVGEQESGFEFVYESFKYFFLYYVLQVFKYIYVLCYLLLYGLFEKYFESYKYFNFMIKVNNLKYGKCINLIVVYL